MEKGKQRISPLYNDIFLRVFGTDHSKEASLGLANAVLHAVGAPKLERVDEVSAERTEPGGAFLKSARLDVVLRCEERYVDFEPQRDPIDVHNKSMFYASKLIAGHTPKGGSSDYDKIPEIAVITLLDGYNEFTGDDFLTVGRIHWERDGGCIRGRGNPLIVAIELKKFEERYNQLTEEVLADDLLAWLYLLTNGYKRDEEVAAMSERFEGMIEFAREYGYALDDPELERAYDREQSAIMEYNSAVKGWKKKGMEEGRAEVIASLRKLGVDEAILAQVSD